MEHSEAVRIARSGEGAIVGELIRLDKELADARQRIAVLDHRTSKFLDALCEVQGITSKAMFE